MNIFITSKCAIESAKNLCDKHIPKLVVEDFQMLTCAVIRHGAPVNELPLTKSGNPAKGGYHRHPCSVWAGDTRSNFNWLVEHAKETCAEYTLRYGKVHFCEKGINTLSFLNYLIPEGELQPFAVAINQESKCRKVSNFDSLSTIDKYRLYVILDKPFAKWDKGAKVPEWFNDKKYREMV
jgi:hypothetical protein